MKLICAICGDAISPYSYQCIRITKVCLTCRQEYVRARARSMKVSIGDLDSIRNFAVEYLTQKIGDEVD
jgi:hypothetical protein